MDKRRKETQTEGDVLGAVADYFGIKEAGVHECFVFFDEHDLFVDIAPNLTQAGVYFTWAIWRRQGEEIELLMMSGNDEYGPCQSRESAWNQAFSKAYALLDH